ncbi:MerR family transcriptional regulator [Paenibacillus sp. 32O-W]|uniref:MerR family transcriptional regulator n=1 Tax=Paenibacillus sp. 32O-W TaxID=1695218 RepID=UPI000721EB1A|nr:MerR family transcriptional regulator [Paenibacillus sp. 32O-W]ALS29591.1 MerR family transcriptional regulator [Paenibacillus sp. 32O-W]
MRRWTTGQISRQRNISVRTLRYYDQIGLLCPSEKDEHGRRYYSEEDLFTLEKISLLKSLALPLEEIAQMLNKVSYREVLIAHHNYLQEQLISLQTSIANTASLINMIDLEGSLSWERVSSLVKQAQSVPKRWKDYFHEDELAFLQKSLPALESSDRMTQQYVSLLRRIEWCLDNSIAPQSSQGLEIANQLIQLSNETFGGNQDLADKFWEVRKLPAEESGLYPITEEVLSFVEQSIAYAEQRNRNLPNIHARTNNKKKNPSIENF